LEQKGEKKMNFNINEAVKEKLFVVAHRGVAGGNIPCNTISAYEIALKQGADMIEIDLNTTADGHLVIFHPGMEPAHLCSAEKIPECTIEEVKKFRFVNSDNVPTQFGVETFDDVLEHFKGRCFINVDKFWNNPVQIYGAIKRHNMQEQILVKSSFSENVLTVLEELAPELAFMPIVNRSHPHHEDIKSRNINYVGAEVLFRSDDDEVCSPEFIDMMHRDDKIVWANSIIYNVRDQISAGHSDDTALTEDMEKGWGWLVNRGFDIIQTDWPLMLINFLKETGRYYK